MSRQTEGVLISTVAQRNPEDIPLSEINQSPKALPLWVDDDTRATHMAQLADCTNDGDTEETAFSAIQRHS